MKASWVRKCMELPVSCFTWEGNSWRSSKTFTILDTGKMLECPNILQPRALKCSLPVASNHDTFSPSVRNDNTDAWVSWVGHSSPPAGPYSGTIQNKQIILSQHPCGTLVHSNKGPQTDEKTTHWWKCFCTCMLNKYSGQRSKIPLCVNGAWDNILWYPLTFPRKWPLYNTNHPVSYTECRLKNQRSSLQNVLSTLSAWTFGRTEL